jgi:hypothetical protein
MLCAQFILRKRGSDPEEIRPLPCRSWGCEYCAPARRRQLMAQAAAGEPNKLLTLTVNINTGETPGERRDMLHLAWKNLVKRINRQFQLKPERRWQLQTTNRSAEKEAQVRRITTKTAPGEIKTVPYFAFLERTKRGEPHLHILLRLPFVPQDWLSEQMQDLLRSPVVWIEAIKGAPHAVAYVTKYITKAPAQWGNKKRYWQSRNWQINKGDDSETTFERCRDVELLRTPWREYAQNRVRERWTFEETADGWFRLWRPGTHPGWQAANRDMAQQGRNQEMPTARPG